jgi:hypothetical protein
VHEATGARVETEYTADDYELPAGETRSIYYDCDWDHYLSAESVVSSSLAGTVQQFSIWSKLNLAATELAMYGRVPPLDLVASGHLTA